MKLPLALLAAILVTLSSLAACITINTGAPCPCDGAGGTAAVAATASASSGDAPCAGPFCSAWLGGSVSSDETCPASSSKANALIDCACDGVCAAVCGIPDFGDCLSAWAGAEPLDCQTCLISVTGCKAAWDTCVHDDGSPAPSTSSTSSTGGLCTCDPALLACPGGGSCLHIGELGPVPGNEFCGTAEVCVPCCNVGDSCGTEGKCQVTKIDSAACAEGYECCSGVCTDGHCVGGCGVILPGSGAGASSSSSAASSSSSGG